MTEDLDMNDRDMKLTMDKSRRGFDPPKEYELAEDTLDLSDN